MLREYYNEPNRLAPTNTIVPSWTFLYFIIQANISFPKSRKDINMG